MIDPCNDDDWFATLPTGLPTGLSYVLFDALSLSV